MKPLYLLSACSILLSAPAFTQNVELPAGYHVQVNASGQLNSIQFDFDGDGATDIFRAIERGVDEDVKLMASLKNGTTRLFSKPTSMCCGSISQKSGVVTVGSKGMRGFSYYKFRWDKTAQDFRLIGYETESFGNAVHDGRGTSSLNLITGDYEATFNSWDEKKQDLIALPKVKRRIPIRRKIYLKNFGEEADDWLLNLNYKYLPKEVQ